LRPADDRARPYDKIFGVLDSRFLADIARDPVHPPVENQVGSRVVTHSIEFGKVIGALDAGVVVDIPVRGDGALFLLNLRFVELDGDV
jgi:hypothetical protein